MKRPFTAILLALWTLQVGAPQAFATADNFYVISTLPAWNGSSVVSSMAELADGSATSATFGQLFRAPAGYPVLQQFSFWVEGLALYPDPMHFGGYLMEWDGLRAAGSILYESDPQTAVLGQLKRFDFNLNVALEPEKRYVFFISCSEYFNGLTSKSTPGAIVTDPYPGGDMVSLRNGPDFSQITSRSWSLYTGWDFAFEASFTQVPEPAVVPLLGLGSLILMAATKRTRA